ncbi:MAG: TolC family protein [Bryobacteraceae bacterium]
MACASGPASAQTGSLTLEDCVRLAMRAPSAVTIARQDRRIADYGVTAARSSFLPQLQLGNGFMYNSPPQGSSSAGGISGRLRAGWLGRERIERSPQRTRIMFRSGEVAQADVVKPES